VAFSQHFSLRNSLPGEDPWIDAEGIVSRSFPNSETVLDAFAENPNSFVAHVVANVGDIGTVIKSQVLGISGGQASLLTFAMVITLGLSFIVSLLVSPRAAFSIGASMRRNLASWRLFSSTTLAWGTVLFAVLLATIPLIVVFPRDHYVLAPAGMALVLLVALQRRWGSASLSRVLPLTLVLALFALSLAQTVRAVANRVVYPAPLARSVALLAQSDKEWVLLSADWGVNSSLEVFVPGVEIVSPTEIRKDETMREFLDRRGVNALWRPFEWESLGISTEETPTGALLMSNDIRLDALFPGSVVFMNQTGSDGPVAPSDMREQP
jgi:hypothetical protein